jgi:FkbM family methyltransferase
MIARGSGSVATALGGFSIPKGLAVSQDLHVWRCHCEWIRDSRSSREFSQYLDNSMSNLVPLSYAQNMEDYHLWLAFKGKPSGTYIDIGGGHPVAGSVSFWFYERGWSGLVVEPQAKLAALHRQIRPRDALVESLIGKQVGKAEFFLFDRLHGLSTTIPLNASAAGVDYRTELRETNTLADICRRLGRSEIDFLKIDVEGAEEAVIEGGDWDRYRPGIVVVEAVSPLTGEPTWSAWENLLTSQGYRFVLFDTLNRFYVADERADLLATMPSERASWDNVRHMYEIGRAVESDAHPDHLLARLLMSGFWASLPFLSQDTLNMILQRGAELEGVEGRRLQDLTESDAFRGSLGLIASAYDGGFLDEPNRLT